MGTLSKKHFSLDPLDRVPSKKANQVRKRKFDEAEDTIEEVAVDVVNGVPKADILQKLKCGLYSSGKKYSESMAYQFYDCGMKRIAINRCDRIDQARDILWNRYENLYKESLESGNLPNARACLADMAKIFGVTMEQAPPSTAVQINTADKSLTVNFGFLNKQEEEDGD